MTDQDPTTYTSNPFKAFWQAVTSLNKHRKATAAFILANFVLYVPTDLLSRYLDLERLDHMAIFLAWVAISLLLYLVITTTLVHFGLRVARGQAVKRQDLIHQTRRHLWPMGLSMTLYGLAVTLGFFLLIVPGIIVMLRLVLSPYFVADQNARAVASLKSSNQLMKGRVVEVIGLVALLYLLYALAFMLSLAGSVILSYVSYILTVVIMLAGIVAFAHKYDAFREWQEIGMTKPKTHHANIWLPIVLVLAGLAATIAFIVSIFISAINGTSGKTYETPCYTLTIPAEYQVKTEPDSCYVTATTTLWEFEYRPIDDPAVSSRMLYDRQVKRLFPDDRYKLDKEMDHTVGDAFAVHNSATEKSSNQTVLVFFVRSQQAYPTRDGERLNFVLIQRSLKPKPGQMLGLRDIMNSFNFINTTVTWKPLGNAQFRLFNDDADAAWAGGDYVKVRDKGDAAYKAATTSTEKAIALYWRGVGAFQLGDLGSAEADAKLAVELDPVFPSPMQLLGSIALQRNDFAKALEYARLAVERDPNYAWGYNLHGSANLKLGHKNEAIQDFQRAIELDPEEQIFKQNLHEAQNSK